MNKMEISYDQRIFSSIRRRFQTLWPAKAYLCGTISDGWYHIAGFIAPEQERLKTGVLVKESSVRDLVRDSSIEIVGILDYEPVECKDCQSAKSEEILQKYNPCKLRLTMKNGNIHFSV